MKTPKAGKARTETKANMSRIEYAIIVLASLAILIGMVGLIWFK